MLLTVQDVLQEAMVARRVLLAVDGPDVNVIKIKPPMVFAEAEVDHLMAELDQVQHLISQPKLITFSI